MTIYKKILQAQKALGYVEKKGHNNFSNYDYATEADVLHAVKQAANDAGLILITSTTAELGMHNIDGKAMRWAHAVLSYKVIDAETGETVEGTFDGYAEDKGDKAVYKATTGANKYFLMKFFGVPTGDDPERDDEITARPAEKKPRKAASPQVPAPQAQPAQPKTDPTLAPSSSGPTVAELKNAIFNVIKSKNINVQTVQTLAGGRWSDIQEPSRLADLLAALQAV